MLPTASIYRHQLDLKIQALQDRLRVRRAGLSPEPVQFKSQLKNLYEVMTKTMQSQQGIQRELQSLRNQINHSELARERDYYYKSFSEREKLPGQISRYKQSKDLQRLADFGSYQTFNQQKSHKASQSNLNIPSSKQAQLRRKIRREVQQQLQRERKLLKLQKESVSNNIGQDNQNKSYKKSIYTYERSQLSKQKNQNQHNFILPVSSQKYQHPSKKYGHSENTQAQLRNKGLPDQNRYRNKKTQNTKMESQSSMKNTPKSQLPIKVDSQDREEFYQQKHSKSVNSGFQNFVLIDSAQRQRQPKSSLTVKKDQQNGMLNFPNKSQLKQFSLEKVTQKQNQNKPSLNTQFFNDLQNSQLPLSSKFKEHQSKPFHKQQSSFNKIQNKVPFSPNSTDMGSLLSANKAEQFNFKTRSPYKPSLPSNIEQIQKKTTQIKKKKLKSSVSQHTLRRSSLQKSRQKLLLSRSRSKDGNRSRKGSKANLEVSFCSQSMFKPGPFNLNDQLEIPKQIQEKAIAKIKNFIRQGEQFKDSKHKTVKHQLQHLRQTYQLQLRLRNELVDKVVGIAHKRKLFNW